MSKSEKLSGRDATAFGPTAWFAVLERAKKTSDRELAARAKRELVRLGVLVQFVDPSDTERKGGSDER